MTYSARVAAAKAVFDAQTLRQVERQLPFDDLTLCDLIDRARSAAVDAFVSASGSERSVSLSDDAEAFFFATLQHDWIAKGVVEPNRAKSLALSKRVWTGFDAKLHALEEQITAESVDFPLLSSFHDGLVRLLHEHEADFAATASASLLAEHRFRVGSIVSAETFEAVCRVCADDDSIALEDKEQAVAVVCAAASKSGGNDVKSHCRAESLRALQRDHENAQKALETLLRGCRVGSADEPQQQELARRLDRDFDASRQRLEHHVYRCIADGSRDEKQAESLARRASRGGKDAAQDAMHGFGFGSAVVAALVGIIREVPQVQRAIIFGILLSIIVLLMVS
jgi:hypothetical protein